MKYSNRHISAWKIILALAAAIIFAAVSIALIPLAKALMNAAIAMLIYKPVSIAMKRAKLIEGKMEAKFNKQSVIMLIIGGVTLAASITIFLILKFK